MGFSTDILDEMAQYFL